MLEAPRSAYLAQLPPVRRSQRGRRIRRRAMFVALCAFIVGIVVWVAIARPLGRASLAWPIYFAHDYFYLPIKGYTYTHFLPVSIVWWSLLALALGLWLASFLSDQSFILRSHIALLTRAARNHHYHGWLATAAAWFHRIGLPGHVLLLHVVERQQALELGGALATPRGQASADRCTRLDRLAELAARLHLFDAQPGIIDEPRLRAALHWQQAMIALHFHGPSKSLERLARFAPHIIDAAPRQPDAWQQAPEISALSLLIDLYVIACCDAPALAEQPPIQALAPYAPANRQTALHFLAATTTKRRRQLETARRLLEREAWKRRAARGSQPARSAPPTLPDDHAALIGELAAGQALLVAILSGQPIIAISFIDALDTLGLGAEMLTLRAETATATASNKDPDLTRLAAQSRALLDHAPSAVHLRVAAALAGEANQRRRRELIGAQPTVALLGGQSVSARLLAELIEDDEHDLVATRIDLLDGAAGPHFDSARSETTHHGQ